MVSQGTFHQRYNFKKIPGNMDILIICEKYGIFRIKKQTGVEVSEKWQKDHTDISSL